MSLRYSAAFTLAIATLLGCGGGGSNDSIYMTDAGGSVTLGNEETTNASQTGDGDGDASGDGDGDGNPGDGDGDGTKLDTLPADTGVDDGVDPMNCDQDVDIVFVMDVSTTMGPFFDKLEAEIQAVDTALAGYNLPNPPHYGLAVFVDDFTLVNAGVPYTDVNTLRADFEEWNNFTATNEQTKGGNFNSTWTENSLDPLFAAAGGFQWRPNDTTLRMIIHTTDDTFWNGPTIGNGVNILHNYAETVDMLQSKQIRMFTFADYIGGMCECDDVSMGFFTDFQGQPPIPMQTGGAAYNIGEVLAGITSLADAITQSVEDSLCEDYPPVD
jgi:hypothetical protein